MEIIKEPTITELNHAFNKHFAKASTLKNEYIMTNAQLLDNKRLLMAQFKSIYAMLTEANETAAYLKQRLDAIESDIYNFERKVKSNDSDTFAIETVEYYSEAKKSIKDLMFLLPRIQEIYNLID